MTILMTTITAIRIVTNQIDKNMNEKTVKIRIWGIVQGVGFRPFVAKLADRMNMKGEVLNIGGLVDIAVTDTEERIQQFLQALRAEKPEPAEIVHMKVVPIEARNFKGFSILDSDSGDDEAAMIPADLAVCPDCLRELYDETNPRYEHSFISCMVCGPRYTIIDKIPYDRENTSMEEFPMCDFCQGEYTNRKDRRYHAQTISCHHCGPMLDYKLNESKGVCNEMVETGEKNREDYKNTILLAAGMLKEGKVVALKGVGGYNLLCDPFNPQAVKDLRKLKGRETKPFAVMFRDIEQIKRYCEVNDEEVALLYSSARPIVLLKEREERALPGSNGSLGVFLPSMGAQYLILDHTGPLVVTSANPSGLPMILKEEEAFSLMEREPLLAGVFYNQRSIRTRVDDSVVRVIDGQPQMIRRGKGYAPVPLYLDAPKETLQEQVAKKERQILAVGGQLKSAFALRKGPFAYVSQYFGDLDSEEACEIYKENLAHLKGLFRIEPDLIVCDKHPLYNTTKFAKEYAEIHGNLPILSVQHHFAHVASVMAENNLRGDVIGVAFDGTGYGDDGKIWGGEFFLCNGVDYDRKAHLEYVKMIGGDTSMKEGWKSALCYAYHYAQGKEKQCEDNIENFPPACETFSIDLAEILAFSKEKKEDGQEMEPEIRKSIVWAALDQEINVIESASMGRLFDAVSSLLGIQQENTYEGECAILLEKAAFMAIENPGSCRKNELALKFHYNVAEAILLQCEKIRKNTKLKEGKEIVQVALTGGVFQNKILMEKSLELLRDAGFQVFYNVSVGPNDGGISLGQLYIGMGM